MSAIYDTVVVGAGPSGSAAAIELSKAGLSTLILDKALFPRDKCCGDGLTALALRHLNELNFNPSVTPSWNWIKTVRIRSTSGRESVMTFPRTGSQYAAVVRRFELDNALLTLARSSGATFLDRTTINSIAIRGDHSVNIVLSNDDSVQARHVVAADGVYSSVRKLLDIPRIEGDGDWHAFRQYFSLGELSDEILVSFEADLLPAYFWSFPLADGTTNLGYGIHSGSVGHLGEMAKMWRNIQGRDHLNKYFVNASDERLKAWPIPANVREQQLSFGPVLFVGDAASASDPLSGEGIGQALETGRLAAQAIVRSSRTDPGSAASRYESWLKANLFADDRWSNYLMKGLSHRKGTRLGVRVAGSSPFLGNLMSRWMFEDFPRHQILNPKTIFSKGTGAY